MIASWLVERGVPPGAEVVDAGCGTGRYAIELARRGYRVDGIDVSPELVEVAKRAAAESQGSVSFWIGDILDLAHERYQAILCRGVLNDILDDGERDAVFAALAKALAPAACSLWTCATGAPRSSARAASRCSESGCRPIEVS